MKPEREIDKGMVWAAVGGSLIGSGSGLALTMTVLNPSPTVTLLSLGCGLAMIFIGLTISCYASSTM